MGGISVMQFNYIRDEEQQATVALLPPKKSTLLGMLKTHSDETKLTLGLAVLSPTDQFNKKVGQTHAKSNGVESDAILTHVISKDGVFEYFFITKYLHPKKLQEYTMRLRLTTSKNSDVVKFIGATLL
jgi:hypothetical protein